MDDVTTMLRELRRLANACPKGQRTAGEDDPDRWNTGSVEVAVDTEYSERVVVQASRRFGRDLVALADFTRAASPEAVLQILDRADGFRDLCFEMLEQAANSGPATSTQIREWQDQIAALDGEAELPPGSAVERAARRARQAGVHALALDIQGDLDLYGLDLVDTADLREAVQRDLDRAIKEVGEDVE